MIEPTDNAQLCWYLKVNRSATITYPAASETSTLAVYAEESLAPRDLRSTDQLAKGGFTLLGPVRAYLATSSGRVPLHSTSEARKLKGHCWAWPSKDVRGPSHVGTRRRTPPLSSTPGAARVIDRHTPLLPKRSRRPTLGAEPRRWIKELFREGFVVIDTETTGLSGRDEVIEIAAVTADGELLYESLVRPRRGFVPAAATKIHGLRFEDVATAPSWPQAVEGLVSAVAGHRLFAWNAPFDMRLCVQSSRAWGVEHPLPGFECAMRAYATSRGASSGSFRLERAATIEGVMIGGQTHRSADDARLTAAVLRRLQAFPQSA